VRCFTIRLFVSRTSGCVFGSRHGPNDGIGGYRPYTPAELAEMQARVLASAVQVVAEATHRLIEIGGSEQPRFTTGS
jgi:hypothetical protein